ncbi:MAG: hypothetical protein ACJ76F_06200 [Bacteroidia bacterium]
MRQRFRINPSFFFSRLDSREVSRELLIVLIIRTRPGKYKREGLEKISDQELKQLLVCLVILYGMRPLEAETESSYYGDDYMWN